MSPTDSQIEAAWQILDWWAEGNDATILESRELTVEVLKAAFQNHATATISPSKENEMIEKSP